MTSPMLKLLKIPFLFEGAALVAGLGIGVVVLNLEPFLLLAVVGGLLVALGTLVKAEVGLLVLIFITYTRFSDVLHHFHGVPSIAQPFLLWLGIAIIIRWKFQKEPLPARVKPVILLLAGYGLVGFLSLFYAVDFERTKEALVDYAKDASIVVVVVLLLTRLTTLRWVIWSLLAAGLFMGTISVYQQLTGTFENNYWGFGQAAIQNIVGEVSDYRIAGPIGDPNFYGQILIVLVSLALDRLWGERHHRLRLLAIWTLAVCVLSIFFTFSRGAFLALVIVLALVLVYRRPNLQALLLALIISLILFQYAPAQYKERIGTVFSFLPNSEERAHNDVSIRGRASEMTVAWQIFSDHPFLGVGLNNYKVHYLDYASRLGIEARQEARSPHSLYLQVAAETGLLGMSVFGLLLWFTFRGLSQARQALNWMGLSEEAGLVVAFQIGLIGYLTASIFLHNAYPRFFWLLLGIALAIPTAVAEELEQEVGEPHPSSEPNLPLLTGENYA